MRIRPRRKPSGQPPGGGITVMVDVTQLPARAFGYVPTPALVAPIEFTLPRALYEQVGGHMSEVVPIERTVEDLGAAARREPQSARQPWPPAAAGA